MRNRLDEFLGVSFLDTTLTTMSRRFRYLDDARWSKLLVCTVAIHSCRRINQNNIGKRKLEDKGEGDIYHDWASWLRCPKHPIYIVLFRQKNIDLQRISLDILTLISDVVILLILITNHDFTPLTLRSTSDLAFWLWSIVLTFLTLPPSLLVFMFPRITIASSSTFKILQTSPIPFF